MRCAIIDIGSNTVKLNVYEADSAESQPINIKTLISQSQTVGLINYISNNVLSDEGTERLCEIVRSYSCLARDVSCKDTECVATASLRYISNKSDVLHHVETSSGCKIRILTGEEEAALSFEAVKASAAPFPRNGYVIDMGGGSTEIVGFSGAIPKNKISIPFGCLSLHNRFINSVLPTKKEMREISEFVNQQVSGIGWLRQYGNTAFLVGGTARAVGKLYCEMNGQKLSNGYRMNTDQFIMLLRKFGVPGKIRVQTMIKVIPDRMHTVIPGLCAYNCIFEAAGIRNIVISYAGVRDGMILQKLQKGGQCCD